MIFPCQVQGIVHLLSVLLNVKPVRLIPHNVRNVLLLLRIFHFVIKLKSYAQQAIFMIRLVIRAKHVTQLA